MKKIILGSTLTITMMLGGVYAFSHSNTNLDDLQMQNIEALADSSENNNSDSLKEDDCDGQKNVFCQDLSTGQIFPGDFKK